MCTVTFWPGEKGFIFTSNRDEHSSRNARGIRRKTTKLETEILFPQDESRGGTWFAVGSDHRCGSILNGAFEPYDISLKFPESRGKMLLDVFNYQTFDGFIEAYDFNMVAPFTLVFNGHSDILYELKWDGKAIFKKELSSKEHHIWSSVTLYPEHVRNLRIKAFNSFIEHNTYASPESLMKFHSGQPFGDGKNDFIMDREGKVQTVSISQCYSNNSRLKMFHKDILRPLYFGATL